MDESCALAKQGISPLSGTGSAGVGSRLPARRQVPAPAHPHTATADQSPGPCESALSTVLCKWSHTESDRLPVGSWLICWVGVTKSGGSSRGLFLPSWFYHRCLLLGCCSPVPRAPYCLRQSCGCPTFPMSSETTRGGAADWGVLQKRVPREHRGGKNREKLSEKGPSPGTAPG